MKRAILLILLISCAYEPEQARYIIDGDTFVLNNGSTIRLAGIDTPEYGHELYDKAAYELQTLIQGKKITLKGENKDTYGRLVKDVYVNDLHVNLELIKKGLARAAWHEKTQNEQTFEEAQKLAIQQKQGMWNVDEREYIRLKHHCKSLGCDENTTAISSINGTAYYNCACGSATKIENKQCHTTLIDAIKQGKRETKIC